MVDQDAARVRRAGALARALEELHADLPLQRRDLLAHGRLGEVESLGRGRERTVRDHLAKDPQPLHVEHKGTLSDLMELNVALIPGVEEALDITNDRSGSFQS